MLLTPRFVAKPWGRRDVPCYDGDERIGETWFDGPPSSPLLIKYLYTSERLSIQVHPDDAQAHAAGLPAGKTECWYIVAAEPGARIGLGLCETATTDVVRVAAHDGSLVDLLDWRAVAAGDFLFVPAGTIHAIGAGITLVEIQQNSDVTYRLFDYGRPRPLQLDDGLAVARLERYRATPPSGFDSNGNGLLVADPAFTVSLVQTVDAVAATARWVVPLAGFARGMGEAAGPGACLYFAAGEVLILDRGARALIATTAR